jgi:hypothetical protein
MEQSLDKVYLYDNAPLGCNCCVVRTHPPSGDEDPGYSSENCPKFSEKVWDVIKVSFNTKDFTLYFNSSYNYERGWTRMKPKYRERFILGCIANDIDIEIIEWEGKK